MKRLLFVLLASVFITFGNNAYSQGLYGDKKSDSKPATEETNTGKSGLLKAKPDPTPDPNPDPNPNPGPVGDSLWLILGMAGIYVIKVVHEEKKKKA